jgi:pantetheine-phosphate adenylyltransferase
MMQYQTAIYAGTFAPVTLGHEEIIVQAAGLFGKLYIAVSPLDRSDLAIPYELRVGFIQQVAAGFDHIEVVELKGSIASLAKQLHAKWLVRGLRNAQDLAVEQSMAAMNAMVNPDLKTIFLQTKPAYQAIQATLVRQLMRSHEDISSFVPAAVWDWYKTLDNA